MFDRNKNKSETKFQSKLTVCVHVFALPIASGREKTHNENYMYVTLQQYLTSFIILCDVASSIG